VAFTLSSSAVEPGGRIPDQYTTSGQNVSPPLAWSDVPPDTKSFALIMEDLDATGGAYVHWVVFNVPGGSGGLPEALPRGTQLPDGAIQGRSGSGGNGYEGPSLSPGVLAHNYRMTLYALDTTLDLDATATAQGLLQAMQGHILAESQLQFQWWNRRAQLACD